MLCVLYCYVGMNLKLTGVHALGIGVGEKNDVGSDEVEDKGRPCSDVFRALVWTGGRGGG